MSLQNKNTKHNTIDLKTIFSYGGTALIVAPIFTTSAHYLATLKLSHETLQAAIFGEMVVAGVITTSLVYSIIEGVRQPDKSGNKIIVTAQGERTIPVGRNSFAYSMPAFSFGPKQNKAKKQAEDFRDQLLMADCFIVGNHQIGIQTMNYFLVKGWEYQQDPPSGYRGGFSFRLWHELEKWSRPKWERGRLVLVAGSLAIETLRGQGIISGASGRGVLRLDVEPGRALSLLEASLLPDGGWIRSLWQGTSAQSAHSHTVVHSQRTVKKGEKYA